VARTVQLGTPEPARHPLVVTADPDLLDDVLRIAADVGVLVDVATDPAAARAWYGPAPLVLLGIDAAPACARARLGRRPSVVLVGRYEGDGPPDWSVADELGVEHLVALPAGEGWLTGRLRKLHEGSPFLCQEVNGAKRWLRQLAPPGWPCESPHAAQDRDTGQPSRRPGKRSVPQ